MARTRSATSNATRIWGRLISEGPSTAEELAEKLDLPYDQVRSQLSCLTTQGKASAKRQRTIYQAVL